MTDLERKFYDIVQKTIDQMCQRCKYDNGRLNDIERCLTAKDIAAKLAMEAFVHIAEEERE
jgi:hypothetical protein